MTDETTAPLDLDEVRAALDAYSKTPWWESRLHEHTAALLAEVERLRNAAREFGDYADNLAAQVLAARQGQDKAWQKATRRKAERDEAREEVERLRERERESFRMLLELDDSVE